MSGRLRQYIGIISAVIGYYLVHEGAHLIAALRYVVFRGISFMGLGMRIAFSVIGIVYGGGHFR